MKIRKGWKKEIQAAQKGGDVWSMLLSSDKYMPGFFGALALLVVSKNQIVIHDIGSNGRNNSCILRK